MDGYLRARIQASPIRLSCGGVTLMILLLGSAGCTSGDRVIDHPPASDYVASPHSLDPEIAEETLGCTLPCQNPFSSAHGRLSDILPASVVFSSTSGHLSGHAEISSVWAQVDATWNARDAEGFSRLFAEDVSFTFVQRRQSLDGRATIFQHFSERFPRFAPDLRHRTHIGAVRAIAPGVFTADGKVEILRIPAAGDAPPAVLRTFAIFAVMAVKDDEWSIRALRVYQLSPSADDPE